MRLRMVKPDPPAGDVTNDLRFVCVACGSACTVSHGSYCFVDLDGPVTEARYWCKPCAAKELR